MEDIIFHLSNKGLEGLESFVLVFLCTYKHGFFTNMVHCKWSAVIHDIALMRSKDRPKS